MAPCALFAAALLCACPQLLEDEFEKTTLTSSGLDAGNGGREPTGNDTVPPSMSSSTPASGATGVLPDTVLEVTFSEPMDTTATIAAYTSSRLPSGAVSFAWSNDDRTLSITPRQPLPVATGPDLNTVAALSYDFAIGSGARDRAGNALAPAPASVAFSTARAIALRVEAVKDRTLTGNWRGDGVYGINDCQEASTTVCAGDSPATTLPTYRGFLSFDLSLLPADRVGIAAARLGIQITSVYSAPFTTLGALRLEQVSFDAIGPEAFQWNAEAALGVLATTAIDGEQVGLDVLASVQTAASQGHLAQFRLRFDSDTNSDALPDLVVCDWNTAALDVTVLMR